MPPPPTLAPLPLLTPTPAAQQIQAILHECDSWLDRLIDKYGLPRQALIRMLDRKGALEDEIGILIAEWATRRAADLLATEEQPPTESDLFSRAVCGIYARLVRQQAAAAEAEKLRRYRETDARLARMRAGEDDA